MCRTVEAQLLLHHEVDMNCYNLVVLKILGSISFVTVCIVETTSLKLDQIAAGHASETALTRAMIAH
jgi:hypothetical protein